MKSILSNTKYLFAAAVVAMVIICYHFAFQNTIAAWQLNRQLKARIYQSQVPVNNAGYLERKQVNLSRILNNYVVDTNTYRAVISVKLALLAEKYDVRLADLPVTSGLAIKGDKLLHQSLTVSGNYFALIRFLNEIESIATVGTIRTARLFNVQGQQGMSAITKMTIYLYSIPK